MRLGGFKAEFACRPARVPDGIRSFSVLGLPTRRNPIHLSKTMSKQKTHKGLKARVSITGRGKVKFRKSGSSHRNSVSSGQKKRQRRAMGYAARGDIARLERALRCRLTPRDEVRTPRPAAAEAAAE